MGLAIGLLSFVLILTCLLLGLLILIQLPKKDAGGVGQAFGGGATDALFGTGSGNALTKATKYAASTFVILCVVVSWLTALQSRTRNQGVKEALNSAAAAKPAAVAPATMNPVIITNNVQNAVKVLTNAIAPTTAPVPATPTPAPATPPKSN